MQKRTNHFYTGSRSLRVQQLERRWLTLWIGLWGIGYIGGSSLLLLLVLLSLWVWYTSEGNISPDTINNVRTEWFYWVTITFSQTLATALGDWSADTAGLGYTGRMALFSGLILLLVALHFLTRVSKTLLFWAAFVLTRPLGAVVGDFLDKPLSSGGLDLSRFTASIVLLVVILGCVYWSKHKNTRLNPT